MTDIDLNAWSHRLHKIKDMQEHDHAKTLKTDLSRKDVNDLLRIIDMAKRGYNPCPFNAAKSVFKNLNGEPQGPWICGMKHTECSAKGENGKCQYYKGAHIELKCEDF